MNSPSLVDRPTLGDAVDLLDAGVVERHLRAQMEPVDAIPVPLPEWGRHCGDAGGGVGLARGWHVTIAGATGAGKSLFAINCGAKAIEAGERVAFVSLEMSRDQLASRLYAIIGGLDIRRLERGRCSPEAAAEAAERLAEVRERTRGRFYTNQYHLFEIQEIVALMETLRDEAGVSLFVLDYLQLAAARDAETLFRQVSNVSAAVREFAQREGVVTLGVSQFNRSTSANRQERPIVQGLMGTSSLENDSDQVVLLDHTRYRREDRSARTWAILGKNRHGATGEIPILWDYRTLRVREQLPHEEGESWP